MKTPQTQHNKDRLRRAESWLERSRKVQAEAEQATSPEEKSALICEQFIFLWIAFNAAYGQELPDNNSGFGSFKEKDKEKDKFNDFLKKILDRDCNNDISTILWNTYPGPVRVLLNNRYVFGPFWDYVREARDKEDWEQCFKRDKSYAARALGRQQNVLGVLGVVFNRLYVLRNQIIHGGVTTGTGWGQPQIRDGSRIMASLVPKILEIMRADIEENPASETWGHVAYPRFREEPDV